MFQASMKFYKGQVIDTKDGKILCIVADLTNRGYLVKENKKESEWYLSEEELNDYFSSWIIEEKIN